MPMSLDEFKNTHLFQKPMAAAGTGVQFRGMVSWGLLAEALQRHDDSWLADKGQLPHEDALSSGKLDFQTAASHFSESGKTLLLRHAEKSHRLFAAVAEDFRSLFQKPVDLQVYCTPASKQGFGWHYDLEDVFIIQTGGSKEFFLRANSGSSKPTRVEIPSLLDWDKLSRGPEMRCLLNAGDFLYIPAGYWHKACAQTDSYHLSVGVMF